jgi:hypothetical protein
MVKSLGATMSAFRRGVLERDGTTCQCCGIDVTNKLASIQHRIPRGAGGSIRVDRVSNGALVCGSATTPGSCHNWMEHEARTEAGRQGWLLPKNNPDINPEQEPILLFNGWHLLLDDGSRIPYTGEGAA